MAFLSPFNWTLGLNPSHTQLAQDLISNPLSLRSLNDQSLRVHRTAVQSMTNNTRLAITWQAASYQTGITWSSGTNPTRLTVNVTGLYLLVANVKFANTAGGRRGVGWRKNGLSPALDLQNHPANGVDTVSGMELIDLLAGDYIEVWGFQNSGAAINTSGTTAGDVWAHLSLFSSGNRTQIPRWAPPRAWADTEKITAAMFNTQIRDEVLNLRNLKGAGAKVWLSEDQSVTSESRQIIRWDRNTRNVGGIWDGGSKFVAPVAGYYLLVLDVEWQDSGNAPNMGIGYRLNDLKNHDLQMQEGDTNGENQSGGDLVPMLAGDFIEVYAYQDSGESISVHGASEDRSRCSITLWAASQ